MKQVGIYISPIDPVSGPVFKKQPYTNAYPQLFALMFEADVQPILVHDQASTYVGEGVFSEYYEVERAGAQVVYHRRQEMIKLDFIYDKARFEADDVVVLNLPGVRDVCRDKMVTYEMFPELHPHTVLLRNKQSARELIGIKHDSIVVVKGLDSNEGREVYIGAADRYQYDIALPIIVQDFVETACGYNGLVDGRHDVRVMLFDGDVIGGKLRTPLPGGYLSNIRFGGPNHALLPSEIPKELTRIAQQLDQRFSEMCSHRFIAADFGYNGENWVLFEINPWPGLVDTADGRAEEYFMRQLANHLAQCADGL